MSKISVGIFVLIIILAGFTALQIFLSKRKNKWLGLILPIICFAYSCLMVIGIVSYADMSIGEFFALFISTFLIANIPTIILVVIYLACREKFKPNKEMEKMNIQDL